MCLYTPQATRKRVKASSSSSGTNPPRSTSSLPRTRDRQGERQPMPRGAQIILNQPAPIPPPVVYPQYSNMPRVEVIGDGETTNIYLPSPAPTQNGQFQGQNSNRQQSGGQGAQNGGSPGQNQNNQGRERRRSSGIVQEVEGVMRLAKRVGDAVRRGSASSFGRGRDFYREEARRERSRERRSHKDRERERERERRRRYERTPSTSRSRSRERRREVTEVRDLKELKVVDEEARQMARSAGGMAENLVREREVKREAKRLAEKKVQEEEKREERLADRVISRYGSAGLLGPPPPHRGRRLLAGGDDLGDRNGGGDWRENVSWAPWNANSYANHYVVGPPAPPQPPVQAHTNNSSNGSNNNNNNGGGNGDGKGGRREQSRSTSRERTRGSNHIHVHTAPLVQGPQISTTAPGGASSGAYGEMPGMAASSNSTGARRSSWVEPYRQVRAALENSMSGIRGYGGLGLGMPGVQTQFVSGVTPIHAMNGMGMGIGMGMGGGMGGMGVHEAPVAVPIGEREWQRARVYSSQAPDNGLGGMMY